MKWNIPWDKRTLLLLAGSVFAVVFFWVLIRPLLVKTDQNNRELKALESELSTLREAINRGSDFQKTKHLLTRNDVSKVINELSRVGTALNVSFLSTSLQPIQQAKGSRYPVLPVRMNIQSAYEDLGAFFGALETLEHSIVTVREFTIERKPDILPAVYTHLVVDIHLKEGEGG